MFRSSMTIIRELYLYLNKSYIYVKTLGKITSLYIRCCGSMSAMERYIFKLMQIMNKYKYRLQNMYIYS